MHGRPPRTGSDWPTSQRIFQLCHEVFCCPPQIFKIHPYKTSWSIPPGPEFPKIFHATDLTTSFVMFMGIKIDVLSYTSSVEQGVGFFHVFYHQDLCNSFIYNACFFLDSSPIPVFQVEALPLFLVHKLIWLPGTIFLLEKGSKFSDEVAPHFDSHNPSPDTP